MRKPFFSLLLCAVMLCGLISRGLAAASALANDGMHHTKDTVAVIRETNGHYAQYSTLQAAISAVPQGSEATITIVRDISTTGPVTINNGKRITLISDGKDHTISIAPSDPAMPCFDVKHSSILTLGGGSGENGTLTVTNTSACKSICDVWTNTDETYSKLILQSGAVLQAGANTAIRQGIVHTWNANLAMSGGTIDGNSSGGATAEGVNIQESKDAFVMTGGTITNCSANGVHVGKGSFRMTGGKITNCSATGGCVYAAPGGTVHYEGGTIADIVAVIGNTPYPSLHDAIRACESNKAATIAIVKDITLTEPVDITGGRKVAIVSGNGDHTLSFQLDAAKEYCMSVSSASTLTLGGGSGADGILTVTNQSSCTKLVDVWTNESSTAHSALVLREGAVLQAGAGTAIGQSIVHTWHADFAMSGGRIDGNSGNGASASGVVIQETTDRFTLTGGTITACSGSGVHMSAGSFEMTGGTITACSGSGVYMSAGSFGMTGGEITKCSNIRGGGVHLQEGGTAKFTMNGGTIRENEGHFDGGGVYVAGGSFTLDGGLIAKNQAGKNTSYADSNKYLGRGGGVAIFNGARFTMTGGSVTGNVARIQGGGIYFIGADETSNEVWNYEISAGTISDNRLTDTTYGYGGGIYVDKKAALQLTNTLIKGNTATALGGGIWSCRTGDIKIYVTQGGAVYANDAVSGGRKTAGQAGDDIASTVTLPANGFLLLSHHMLGGGANRYSVDGGVTGLTGTALYGYGLGAPDGKTPRYDAAASALVTQTHITKSIALKNVVSEAARAAANREAKLVITGNSASRGGGIGTNGSLIIGTPDPDLETGSLTVKKEVAGNNPETELHPIC